MEDLLTPEELERLPYLQNAISDGLEKIMELEIRKTSIRSSWPSGNGGSDHSPKGIDDHLAFILDQQEKIRRRLQEIQEEWYNTIVKVSQIKSLRMRLIVEYRFEDQLTWQEVADKIGGKESEYSVKSAFSRWMKRQEALSQET